MDKIPSQTLFWTLLKSVSRSFYLSLRYLPAAVRMPLSLAYLIARLADTIADSNKIPVDYRKNMLSQLKVLIQTPENDDLLSNLNQDLRLTQNDLSDTHLIHDLDLLFSLLNQQTSVDKKYIQDVLAKILEGQWLDLYFFDSKTERVHFTTAQELDHYLYLVAGCVGEFWTALCVHHIPGYSDKHLEDLRIQAIHFGKALQLTNILRDMPQDALMKRFYLPYPKEAELNTILCALIHEWKNKAFDYLNDALQYIQSIKNYRIQFACLVPYYIARKTLLSLKDEERVESYTTLSSSASPISRRVKVSRHQVYMYIVKALCFILLGEKRKYVGFSK